MYEYEIWFDGCVVRYDGGFENYEEAYEDAECIIKGDLMEEYEDTEYEEYEIKIFAPLEDC